MISSRFGARARLFYTAGLLLLVSALIAAVPSRSIASQAGLSWNASVNLDGTPITGLTGYTVHVGTAPGSYSQHIDVGNVTSFTVNGLNDGTTYYFAITAHDAAGNVSGFSNEESKSFPADYTLTASAGTGGNVNPPSTVLHAGESFTFFITPSNGYQTANVTVDAVSVGAVSEYTFSNVSTSHTLSATFTPLALVKLIGSVQGTFPLLQESYDVVPVGTAATALVRAQGFSENLVLDKEITFTLKGGYDAAFAANPDMSIVDGTLSVQRGALMADNLIIR
jgi:hypothetical protein